MPKASHKEIERDPWVGLPDRRQRLRRATLDRETIVAAAVRIIDAEGADALSMRRLAVELGSGATSIYRHVRDKDELINLAFDEVTGEIELPERGTGWEHALVAAARGLRDLFHRHRNFVTVIGRRSALGPHSLEIIERLVGILRESGLADRAAYQAVSAVIHYAVGFTILEIIPGLGGPSGATPEYRLLLNRYLDALPADAYPNSLAVAPLMIGKDDEDFDYGVHAIVAGIRALELLDTTRSR